MDAYRRSFLCLPDGMPMVLTSRLLGLPLRRKVSGSDVFEPLLARCAEEGLPVFFLGSTAESCERAFLTLKDRYPAIEITGYDDSMFDPEDDPTTVIQALHRARASAPGSSSARCRRPSRCCSRSSCGSTRPQSASRPAASLGFFVGDVKRAPTWVSRLSFEWLWRLVHEPARLWRRYLVEDVAALPVFLDMVLDRLAGRSLTDVDVVEITGLRRRRRSRRSPGSASVGSAARTSATDTVQPLAS